MDAIEILFKEYNKLSGVVSQSELNIKSINALGESINILLDRIEKMEKDKRIAGNDGATGDKGEKGEKGEKGDQGGVSKIDYNKLAAIIILRMKEDGSFKGDKGKDGKPATVKVKLVDNNENLISETPVLKGNREVEINITRYLKEKKDGS